MKTKKNQESKHVSKKDTERTGFKPDYKVKSADFGANRMSARSCRCHPDRC